MGGLLQWKRVCVHVNKGLLTSDSGNCCGGGITDKLGWLPAFQEESESWMQRVWKCSSLPHRRRRCQA